MITKRQIRILKTLYQSEGYLSFQEIASQLDVSVKTIRNDVASIKDFLMDQDAGTIETKPHLGIRLMVNQPQWDRIFGAGQFKNAEEDRDILFQVIRHLLSGKVLNAQSFAETQFISRTHLDKILSIAENWFYKKQISFHRRRGKGIEIECSEFQFRLANWKFYSEFKECFQQSARLREPKAASIGAYEYTALCSALNGFDVDMTAECLNRLEAEYGLHFSYTAAVQILFFISLSITRLRKGNTVKIQGLSSSQSDMDRLMCSTFCEFAQKHFLIRIPPEEREYIIFVIAVSEIQGFYDDNYRRTFESHYIDLCKLTIKFVNLTSEISGVNLRQDKFFVRQIFLQLRVMIARLRYQTEFQNPLLRQIKEKYPDMMAITWSACNLLEKECKIRVNEHEAAFLALHIGGALERSMSHLSACIVCDYGVGISQILREKIELEIPELTICAVLSNRDVKKIRGIDCDFIISTIPLEGISLHKEVVVVGHILAYFDVKLIEAQMKKTRLNLLHRNLHQIKPSRELFSRELLFLDLDLTDKNQILHMMCARMESQGYVTDGFEKTVTDRETYTSTEVGRGIALPHGLPEYVVRSAVAFARLKKPIVWFDGDDEVDLIFLLALDIKDEKNMAEEIIKFYKSFARFIDDETAIAKIRSGNTAEELSDLLKNL